MPAAQRDQTRRQTARHGLGATVAFGVFAVIGVPMLILGLGIFSAALDS
jgi:hypothetical protein